jgi:UDP-3-O-[3-hydroxymyristoyl] glucosamine N-acyltransferase
VTTLDEWAAIAGGHVRGDGSTLVNRVGAIEEADGLTLTFAIEPPFMRAALASPAAAVLTDEKVASSIAEPAKPLLIVPSVRAALVRLLRSVEAPLPKGPYRHPSAAVADSAQIGPDVYLGACSVVGDEAVVGAGSVLLAGAVIGRGARLGAGSLLHPNSVLHDRCIAGQRVVLHPGAVVGSDGFGFALVDGALTRIPQVGIVELGDDVEIGANACVDRAQTGVTRIGRGTKIDNLVQIGHNCRIGANCAFAALTGLAGSTTIGDYVEVGGQTGFKGHLTVGSRVRIAGQSAIYGDIPDGATVSGHPARDHQEELRHKVRLRNLDKLFDRVQKLEERLEAKSGDAAR